LVAAYVAQGTATKHPLSSHDSASLLGDIRQRVKLEEKDDRPANPRHSPVLSTKASSFPVNQTQENSTDIPSIRRTPLESFLARPYLRIRFRIVGVGQTTFDLHSASLAYFVTGTTNEITGTFDAVPRGFPQQAQRLLGIEAESNVPPAAASSSEGKVHHATCELHGKTSRFSNEGALIHVRSGLGNRTEISSNSANSSWLILSSQPNPFYSQAESSRKLAPARPRGESGVLASSTPPNQITGTIQRKSEGGGFENQGKVSGERGQVSSELRSRERWLFRAVTESLSVHIGQRVRSREGRIRRSGLRFITCAQSEDGSLEVQIRAFHPDGRGSVDCTHQVASRPQRYRCPDVTFELDKRTTRLL